MVTPAPRLGRGASDRGRRPPVVAVVLAAALLGACDRGAGTEGPLPELSRVPDAPLVDQAGNAFRPRQGMAGQVWVANFVFTSCQTVCPMLSSQMRTLQGKLGDEGLRMVSFSVDPETDTPEALRAYARRFDADLDRWTFVTGEPDVVRRTIVDGFKLYYGEPAPLDDPPPDAPPDAYDIPHATYFALVDRTGTIRGYYRNDAESQARLEADARRLLGE